MSLGGPDPFLHYPSIVSPRASLKECTVTGRRLSAFILKILSSQKNLDKHYSGSPSLLEHLLYLMFFDEGNSRELNHDSIPENVAILKSLNR